MAALHAVYCRALELGANATVWYRDLLQYHEKAQNPIIPLYFLNPRKQLFCIRNCYFQARVAALADILTGIPCYGLYRYEGADGDTFAVHTMPGIDEDAEHCPKYDYSGLPVGLAARRHLRVSLSAAISASLRDTSSRKQYTSILLRTAAPWREDGYVKNIGAVVLAALPGHAFVASYLRARQEPVTVFFRTQSIVNYDDADGTVPTDGWKPMRIAEPHRQLIPAGVMSKTITASGDCMYSSLAYALLQLWTEQQDVIRLENGRLYNFFTQASAQKSTAALYVFLRNYINALATPEVLCRHFCEGDWAAFRTWILDGSLFASGLLDVEADAGFAKTVTAKGYSAGEVLQKVAAYRASNAYWGRDFDLQLFERHVNVGVVVFGSRNFFGDAVNILARKPLRPHPYYVTLYNSGNVHFEVAGAGSDRKCGYYHASLPPWLAYILNCTLAVDTLNPYGLAL
jgi:hypothetical protein